MKQGIIATTSYYNPADKRQVVRYVLALETAQVAVRAGFRYLVVDRSTDARVGWEFKKVGAEVIKSSAPSFGAQKQEAIQAAHERGAEIIIANDPEKREIIPYLHTCITALETGADIVIPERQSFKSLPTVQRQAETLGNTIWHELTGIRLDMWFGPRIMNKNAARYFIAFNTTTYPDWEIQYVPVLQAIKDARKVVGVTLPYEHPSEQTVEEEHDVVFMKKRLVQLHSITTALFTANEI